MNVNTNLPSHLSEATFRVYEPCIKLAVDRFPEETSFDVPPTLSTTTFVARFRDARTSLLRFEWATDVDVKKLWEIAGQYVITLEVGTRKVWFRNKQKAGRPTMLTDEARQKNEGVPASVVPWKDWTHVELLSLCQLISSARLEGPYFLIGPISDDARTVIEQEFNVAITFDETKNISIVL